MGFEEAGDVLDFAEAVKGNPAGIDDVYKHEDLGGWDVDEDVAFDVVGAFVRKFQGLVADFELIVFLECLLGRRTVGILHLSEKVGRLKVGDGFDLVVEDEDGAADVVRMGMTVDEVRDGLVRYVADCVEEFPTDSGWAVDNDDALVRDDEEGLVASLCYHVGAVAEGFHGIALRPDLGT